MSELIEFEAGRAPIYLIKIGENHYPSVVPGDDAARWPYLSGVHGAVQGLTAVADEMGGPRMPSQAETSAARERQLHAPQDGDGLLAGVFARLPEDAYPIVHAAPGEPSSEDSQ